jgi:hypothetical protein
MGGASIEALIFDITDLLFEILHVAMVTLRSAYQNIWRTKLNALCPLWLRVCSLRQSDGQRIAFWDETACDLAFHLTAVVIVHSDLEQLGN